MLGQAEAFRTECRFRPRAWVAVNRQPHREAVTIANLRRKKFAVYCLTLRKRVRHAPSVLDVLRPMFTGYLLVAIEKCFETLLPCLSLNEPWMVI